MFQQILNTSLTIQMLFSIIVNLGFLPRIPLLGLVFCLSIQSRNCPVRCTKVQKQMFFKIGALKSFTFFHISVFTFTEKGLCCCLFLIKLQACKPAALFKKRPQHRCFLMNNAKIFKNSFFIEYLWWLLELCHV